MEKNQKVSLGCGSLILIALIVLILGNADQEELGKEIQALGAEVKSLESSIRQQSREIQELKKALEASRAQPDDDSRPR